MPARALPGRFGELHQLQSRRGWEQKSEISPDISESDRGGALIASNQTTACAVEKRERKKEEEEEADRTIALFSSLSAPRALNYK